MSFGHEDQSRLAKRSRITAFHDDSADRIRGFGFHYIEDESEAYGVTDIVDTALKRWTCSQQTYAVDATSGERIVDVYYELSDEDPISLVSGVQVRLLRLCVWG